MNFASLYLIEYYTNVNYDDWLFKNTIKLNYVQSNIYCHVIKFYCKSIFCLCPDDKEGDVRFLIEEQILNGYIIPKDEEAVMYNEMEDNQNKSSSIEL